MFSTEDEEYACCAACCREVSRADDVYSFGGDRVLCFGCSKQRQGTYEDLPGRWLIAPNIDDLAQTPVQGEPSAEYEMACSATLDCA